MAEKRASELVACAKQRITPGVSRAFDDVVVRASGCWVETMAGKKLLDFTSGIGVTNTGHCHPKVVKAIQDQAAKALHVQVSIFLQEPMVQLAEALAAFMPSPSLDTFFFYNSGSEATEAAVKVARHASGKHNVIVLQGSFHGRTLGALSMTTSKHVYRAGLGPLLPGVFVTPFPYARQMPKGLSEDAMVEYCLSQLELLLAQQSRPADTACLIMEPVLGEGGYVPAPGAYIQGVQRICNANNILFIADEVQSGMGRTGKMFAVEHTGVVPDILVMAKGLASGMPLSCIAAPRALMAHQPPGSMGGTYAGNVVACAASLATLQVFQEEKLLENTVARGQQLLSGLRELQKRYPVHDVRGWGLMVAMEFDGPKGVAAKVTEACHARGLALLTTGVHETIRFIAPLVVSASEVDKALAIVSQALLEVVGVASVGGE